MKYVLPLLLIAFSGFAAEPPVVKSKAAKELLKHPEFKKAMEAAPEFTKAVLKELDKHAPEPEKKLTENYTKALQLWLSSEVFSKKAPRDTKAEKDVVVEMVVHNQFTKTAVPLYDSKNKNWPEHAVKFFDGKSMAGLKISYGSDLRNGIESVEVYGDGEISGKKVYKVGVSRIRLMNMAFYNKVLDRNTGYLMFFLDVNDGKVVALKATGGTGVERGRETHITPHGKKLGYK